MEPKVEMEMEKHVDPTLHEKDETMGAASEKESSLNQAEQKPTCILVLGMAGSGKTTFVQVSLTE